MGKLLLLILIGVALYLVFTRIGRSRAAPKSPPVRDGEMVRCAHCGLHVPADEGVAADGRIYCCEEHRRLGQD